MSMKTTTIRRTGAAALPFLIPLAAGLAAGCGDTAYPATAAAGETGSLTSEATAQNAMPDTVMAAELSRAFRSAARHTLPAVVYVRAQRDGERQARRVPVPEPFRDFFGMPEDGYELPPERVTGTGFFFDEEGHVMTNNHVVEGAERILVRLHDGREFPGEVVGGDATTDVAVLALRTGGADVPVGLLGNSDALQVGDWVLALGNPLGLDFTVTAGIVSAKGRRLTPQPTALESFIQTDAAINPGNSGGPLIDLRGRIVGINSAIFGGQRFVGYGFAVPVNLARDVAEDLMEYGHVRRPRLGVSVSDVTAVDAEAYELESVRGAEINTVEEGSPADEAGLRVGDVVLALEGEPISDANDLTTGLAAMDPGQTVSLTVFRDGSRREIRITLGEFAAEERAGGAAGAPGAAGDLAWLGLEVSPLTPQTANRYGHEETEGVVISAVDRYGAAAQAGVRPGQRLLEMEGEAVRAVTDVRRIAEDIDSGSVVSLRVDDPEIGETIINFRAYR